LVTWTVAGPEGLEPNKVRVLRWGRDLSPSLLVTITELATTGFSEFYGALFANIINIIECR
jgi:hypothetical protein